MTTVGTHQLIIDTHSCQIDIPATLQSGTDLAGKPAASKGLYLIPAQHTWDGCWELTGDLLIEIQTSWEEVLAITYLTLQEYGAGTSFENAVQDLLTSLSEYRESLEEREERLGAPAIADLEKLRSLIRRRPQK